MRRWVFAFMLVAACGPGLQGELTVVGGRDTCVDRDGRPIAELTVEVRAAGDTVTSAGVACGDRFYLDSGPGSYYLHAYAYTADGTTRLGAAAVGPYVVDEVDVDVGTLVVQLD